MSRGGPVSAMGVAAINLGLALGFFVLWMVVDYLYVAGDLDLGALLFVAVAVISAGAHLAVLEGGTARRWGLAVAAALAHVVVLLAAIATLGLGFHAWIGGSM